MEVAFIELGSYSVKFLRGTVERKTVQYFDFCEKILDGPSLNHTNETGETNQDDNYNNDTIKIEFVEEMQFKLIEKYLQQFPSIEKTIINLPSYYSTLRFINLPVKNKKKIEQIIPFQLEDELPYPLTDAHLALFSIMVPKGSYNIALSTHIKQFDPFFQHTQNLACPPLAIIGNESIYQTFVLEHDLSYPIAILDLGHGQSTCYLFCHKKLVGVETSFVCGRITDEIIRETYQISTEDAISFKHKNSFFLTDSQFEKADQDQKDFSLLMKNTFSNFIDDFKRWNVGYKLKTRQSLQKILITGGMSNIKNIDHFLTQELGASVSHLNHIRQPELDDLELPSHIVKSLTSCHGLSYQMTTKNGLSNFCNGNYATLGVNEFPLESISFVSVRVAMACFIFLIALVLENIYISKIDKKITRQITDQLKNPVFGITPSQRRRMLRNPKELLTSLNERNKQLDDQVSILEEISRVDGMAPLVELSRNIDDSQAVELIHFKNEDYNIQATFKAEDDQSLKSLERTFKTRKYNDTTIDLKEEEKILNISYYYRNNNEK